MPFLGLAPPDEYDIDYVAGMSISGGNVAYSFTGTKYSFNGTWDPYSYASIISYAASGNSGTLVFSSPSSLLIDTALMPEEMGQTALYYYRPVDSAVCIVGELFGIVGSGLRRAEYSPPFEQSYPVSIYKSPLGLLSTEHLNYDGLIYQTAQKLMYYKRDTACGRYLEPVKVANVHIDSSIHISPNPCSDVLHINQLSVSANYRVMNMVGTTVHAGALKAGDNSITVRDLPAGIYSLVIEGINGERVVKKVVKE
jgi:hypothetical protein